MASRLVNTTQVIARNVERARLSAVHERLRFRGTPEKAFTDSGFWAWLRYVRTKDEHADDDPVQPLPLHKPHLLTNFTYFLGCPVLALPKSRQIMITWMLAVYAVWVAWRRAHSLVIYQTKKDDDANAMVSFGKDDPLGGRMSFVVNSLPGWLADPHIVKGPGNRVGELIFSNGSRIIGFPQGAHQVCQYTPTLFIADEAGLQEEFEKAYYAIQPAITGTTGQGQLLMASSAYPSFFGTLVDPDPNDEGKSIRQPWMDLLQEQKGIRYYESRHGVPVLETHYSADPDKDPDTEVGRAWVALASKKYPGGMRSSGWQQHYEIQWDVGGGELLFPFLSDPYCPVFVPVVDWRVAVETMDIFAGLDFGARHPTAFEVWGIKQDGSIYALWELYEPCRSIPDMVRKIKACPYYSYIKSIRCDHSMVNRTQMGLTATSTRNMASLKATSLLELFSACGLPMSPGRKGADIAFHHRLRSNYWADENNPRAFITAGCPKLAWELRRLRWKEHRSELTRQTRAAPEQIVDKDNDAFDASAYIFETGERFRAKDSERDGRFSISTIMKSIKEAQKPDRPKGFIYVD